MYFTAEPPYMKHDSAPSDEQHPSSSGLPHDRSAEAGADGPCERHLLERLVRSIHFQCGVSAAALIVASALPFLPDLPTMNKIMGVGFVAFCICIVFINYTCVRDELADAECNQEEAEDINWALRSEIHHLNQDIDHWKAIAFTTRGNLSVVKDDAAAGESRSENQENSAAVFQFPRDGGAA